MASDTPTRQTKTDAHFIRVQSFGCITVSCTCGWFEDLTEDPPLYEVTAVAEAHIGSGERYSLDQWNERPGAEGSTVIDERWSASRSTERGPLRLCGECGARHRGNDDNTLCGAFTPIDDEPCTICDGTGIVPDGLPSNGPAPCSSCGPDNGSSPEGDR